MLYKTISQNELFLWYNGNLIYKKWLNTGQSAVFDLYGFVHGKSDMGESSGLLSRGPEKGSGDSNSSLSARRKYDKQF